MVDPVDRYLVHQAVDTLELASCRRVLAGHIAGYRILAVKKWLRNCG